jgi:hypothetical protein
MSYTASRGGIVNGSGIKRSISRIGLCPGDGSGMKRSIRRIGLCPGAGGPEGLYFAASHQARAA